MVDFNPKEPRVYIFFSADLVGSTQKKQEPQDALCINSWVPNIVGFYVNFEEKFADENIKLWKYNGDEILFYARILSWKDALKYVKKFRNVIETSNSSKKAEYLVKGTVWTAGFPIRNFVLRKPVVNNEQIDFIGPDIDLGFRIATLANVERIAISPELALGLLEVSSESREIKWCFYGRQKLKGIVEEGGIPVVFLSSQKNKLSLQDKEEKLLGRDPEPSMLKDFLVSYFNQSKKWQKRKFFASIDKIKEDPEYSEAYEKACGTIYNIWQDETVNESRSKGPKNKQEILNDIIPRKMISKKKKSR